MGNEARTATQVILELEAKVDNLTNIVESQNFANKLLSNKLSELIQLVKGMKVSSPGITAEAVNTAPQIPVSPLRNFKPTDPERQIPIFAADKLPETNKPLGFRRTSRPETFTGDPNYLDPSKQVQDFVDYVPKAPTGGKSESVANYNTNLNVQQAREVEIGASANAIPKQAKQPIKQESKFVVQNAVPIMQRVVDSNGKSVFLAEVDIVNADTSEMALKTKTKANGNWMASLSPGNYQVVICKKGGNKTPEMQAVQNIPIDGKTSPMQLPQIVIK
jgi:hypothetical protein